MIFEQELKDKGFEIRDESNSIMNLVTLSC